ncbi:MAG: MarR family transcriptional regulator, partial [Opitutus sp.]
IIESDLARHDITQGRFGVLMALWSNCPSKGDSMPLSPAELADRTGVTRATITGLIDTLERAGLVTRTPDPDDRRMMCVALTPRGRALLARVMPDHFRRMAWLMEPLSESERKVFLRLLTKVLTRAAGGLVPAAGSSGA